MKIGDLVCYQGRPCILLGLTPGSVSPRQAYLEDVRSGEQIAVPFVEVEAARERGTSVGPVADEEEPAPPWPAQALLPWLYWGR